MDPPKPSLTWKDVTDLNFLADIILLCGCDNIWEKPWFKPHFRDAMHAWHKLQCAREELGIIDIEACQICVLQVAQWQSEFAALKVHR